ncbi:MAG: hypothetical protein R3248_07110 [Candidatus Promineifilaceae bacterium]|nr:hypothetical protein [Candidatus Promineifilaceae bacterium]
MGRTIGIILIAVSLVGCFILTALMGSYVVDDQLAVSTAVFGFSLGAIILLLPLGAGVFLLWKGRQEEAAAGQAQQQRQVLNIVKTQGQVAISDLAIELDVSRDRVQQLLYDLVGKGLFSGYVNWDEGMLYSRQASDLRERNTCEVCGGQLELAGQGVIRCPYCGTEYFLE